MTANNTMTGGTTMKGELRRTKSEQRAEPVYIPDTDIYENENEFRMEFEVPGVTKDNIDITIDGDQLEIRADISEVQPEGTELKYSEYTPRNFYRRFKIGNDIQRESVKAELTDGILEVVLTKSEEAKPRKISVQ
jgi:HSP20 family molecular chaperone IbpA